MSSEIPEQACITVDDLRNLVGELRMIAASLLMLESRKPTYSPTALAMTALRRVKLKDEDWNALKWANRAHFFSAISNAMRHALVDHARRRRAKGRDNLTYLPPDDSILLDIAGEAEDRPERVILIEEALELLHRADPDLAKLIQMRFYLGYTIPEIARFREMNEKTVDRHLKRAQVLVQMFMEELQRQRSPG